MEVRYMRTAYITEDGNIFECVDQNGFPTVLKTIGTCSSSDEVENVLKEKEIPVKRYKIVEV